ncbi:MAG: YtxH domain-containing protein [Acidobacteria bacterium]|nr:YtxH domain-containing protein [Acidobacteriota bacterium]
MRRFMSFLAGSLCGALLGAVLALLLAPYAGEDLRQRTREKLSGFRDDVREAYDARREQLEAELQSLRKPRAT